MKKIDGGIVLLLFQSEAGISGLDEPDEVRNHSNQNLTMSTMVFDSINSFWVLVFSFTRHACDPVYWIMHFQCLRFIKQLRV